VARDREGGGVRARTGVVIVTLCAVVAAAGCSKVGTATNTSSQNVNPWTERGVLRIIANQEPNSLLRLFSNQAAADDMTALLFEPMFRYDERGNPVPALATTFPTEQNGLISKDGLRITFKLQPKARWSDGHPVTADDVIFTWHAIVDGNNPVVTTAGYDGIKTMIADDPHQVTMVLKKPYGPSVFLFSEGSFPPLPAHLLARFPRIDRLPYDANPVGDGPYILKQWVHGSDLIFSPNPLYWRGEPKLSEVDIRVIPNSVTDVSELKTHEIDVLDGVSKNLIGQLGSIDGIRVVKQLTANYRHLDFNLHNPILADVTVRRAIATSIDFDKIISDVYHGLGQRGSTVIPPMSWAASDLKPLPYDAAAARASLDADGWKVGPGGIRARDGVRLSLSMSTATENLPNQMAEQIVAAELHDAGIDVTIKNYATSVLFAPDGPLYGDRYDMAWIVNTDGTDPDFLGGIGCDYWPPRGANTDFYCNHTVDALLRDAQVHYDFAVRKRDYDRASKILIDEAPYVVVYWDVNVVAENSDVKNFKPSPFITDFWNALEWEI
jgi:peptide/nickel transport system substrate-binding protein